MEECFKCHVPETKALLFDAILPECILKICGKCSAKENIPIIKNVPFPEIEKQQTVYERLSKISGVNLDKKKPFKLREKDELKNLVNANYIFKENLDLKERLTPNFHWVIMRARRMKHLTQEQFAREIHEPEIVVKKIEEGFAPDKIETIIKFEKYLGIRIRKDVEEKVEDEKQSEEIDLKNLDDLTIADLHEMKKKREIEILGKEIEEAEKKVFFRNNE